MVAEHSDEHDHPVDQHAYRLPYHWTSSRFLRDVVDIGITRCANSLRASRVLEMGCGDGYATSRVAGLASRVHGFDLNERAISFARLLVDEPHVSFGVGRADEVVSQAAALDDDVDVVASFEVIEHLSGPERTAFLEGAHGLLRPRQGSLLLTTPNGVRATANPYHAHEFRPQEMALLLQGAGFSQVQISGLYLQPPWPRLEHFADTVPFRAAFRALARAGSSRPTSCRTLIVTARAE